MHICVPPAGVEQHETPDYLCCTHQHDQVGEYSFQCILRGPHLVHIVYIGIPYKRAMYFSQQGLSCSAPAFCQMLQFL